MIKIKNKLIPFKGFSAITLWPFIFYKGELDDVTLNHEMIHVRQQLELLIVGFYAAYFIQWIFRGYKNISFEREAYNNQNDFTYLKRRKLFGYTYT